MGCASSPLCDGCIHCELEDLGLCDGCDCKEGEDEVQKTNS